MKVIIVTDYDGHLNAFTHNKENIRFFLEKAFTHLPDAFEDREQVEMILKDPNSTQEDLEYHLQESCGRSNGNHIEIAEVIDPNPNWIFWN